MDSNLKIPVFNVLWIKQPGSYCEKTFSAVE